MKGRSRFEPNSLLNVLKKKKLPVWLSLACAAALLALYQNFAPISFLKPYGSAYVYDDFSSPTRSQRIWLLSGASCNQVPHKNTYGMYENLGTTSRPGYCDFRSENKNSFLRFITHPFDRRDADKVGFASSVDWGKGGSETRQNSRYSVGNSDSSKSALEGWDFTGQAYLNPENKVRYSFDFRLYNLSILDDGLATSATIGQFHSGGSRLGFDCGDYYPGTAPSPGFYVSVNPKDPTKLDFKVGLKLFEDEIPSELLSLKPANCSAQKPSGQPNGLERKICQIVVWSEQLPREEVFRKWLSVSMVMIPSKTGTFEFFFGLKDSTSVLKESRSRYMRRTFANGKTILRVPTIANKCPSTLFLGNYVLGYTERRVGTKNELLYGYYKKDWLGFGSADSPSKEEMLKACTIRPISDNKKYEPASTRLCQAEPDLFVTEAFKGKYGKFISGGYDVQSEYPPQLITDYDNFRLVQAGRPLDLGGNRREVRSPR